MPRFLRVILVAGALLWPGVARLAAENYELAVAAKMTEIKWKQEDLMAAQRELTILTQFLEGHDDKTNQLNTARSQLASADTQLASIQQDNLVKLTIRMGIETYNTVADTINLGKSAATALVTNGVTSAAGSVAFDQLTGSLTSQGQIALGMDATSLSSPRTVKIKAVSDAARAAYPGLARVQQMLAMSLEGVKVAASMEDPPVELGDTGAILRKNIMVRDEIAAALTSLETIGTEAAAAKTEADSGLVAAQADVDRLTSELGVLTAELDNLKTLWSAEENAARLAANLAAVVPPVNQPTPEVIVIRDEEETDLEYNARVQQAIRDAAQARWDYESPSLLSAIDSFKIQILAAQTEINTGVADSITTPQVDWFISLYGSSGKVDANTTASFAGSIGTQAALEQFITIVTPAATVLPGLIEKVATLTDDYTDLVNLQNRVLSLQQLLDGLGLPTPSPFYAAMVIPGMGQLAAEDLGISLDQRLSQLPEALTNAQAQVDQLAAATDTWRTGITAVNADLEAHLTAAESALTDLIARATAWDAALAAADGLVVNTVNGTTYSRLGYFTGYEFTPVLQHEFNLEVYKNSLLAAAAVPGSPGLAALRDLRNKYDVLVATTPALKDAFDAARQRYQAAYGRVESYASAYLNFPVLLDWQQASAFSSEGHPVDAPALSVQEARYLSLYNTSNLGHTTSLAGGEPVTGQPVLYWRGLPVMRQLPDPGLDNPATYLAHRLEAVKAAVVEEGPGWIPLAPADFNASYNTAMDEVWAIQSQADANYDSTFEPVVIALFGEFSALHDAYVAAHPQPVITVQPAGSVNHIPAGTTHTAQLGVTATGDFLTYQWSMSRWSTEEFGWEDIAGATSSTLSTPALSETRLFRVTISNPGGSVTSEAAGVEVYQTYPTPVFTSANSASGQVGLPFTWTFTTDIAAWISIMSGLPPGLNYNPGTATLEGTPTTDGSYDLMVSAFNSGSVGMQTFHLTIAPGTLAPFDAWIQTWTTTEQRQDFSYTLANGMPAGDGIANVLKYAFNLLGNGPGQVASLDLPCSVSASPTGNAGLPAVAVDESGRLIVLYLRRKAASQPGITYAVEFSSTLTADSWAVNVSATEAATSIDDTWERVLVTDSAAMTGARFVRVRVVRP